MDTFLNFVLKYNCDALSDLVPFVQFKKREKHPWRSVTFSKVAGFQPATSLKVTLLHGFFSFLKNCTNGTKSRKTSQLYLVKGSEMGVDTQFFQKRIIFLIIGYQRVMVPMKGEGYVRSLKLIMKIKKLNIFKDLFTL